MAQLPRCVQQASWKRVSGVCSLTIRSLSCSSSSRKFCSAVTAASSTSASIFTVRPSQSLLVLCGSSPRLSRCVYTDLTRDRLRFVLRRAPVSFVDSVASGNSCSASNGLPALGSLVRRSFSSADASAVVDGEVKDSFSKEEKEAQKSALFAEIEAKERELVELRNALRQAENEGVTVSAEAHEATASVEDPVVQASSVAAEELDTEFYSANGTPSLLAEEDSTSEARSDEDVGDIEENSQVIYLGEESEASPSQSISDEANAASASGEAVEGSDIISPSATSTETEKTPSEHPWPQWTRFLKLLAKGNYFVNEEGKEIDISSVNPDDYGLIKRACLNFARERDDIFTSFAQKDLEIIARFGCPTTDRKVVNAGKRLREFLKIDEVSICKPCALRPSCERADFRVASDHRAGTPEIIRLLSQYALNVSPDAERDLKIPDLVQKSCTNLLQQAVTLGSKARDPKLPKAERKAEMVKSNREDRGERTAKKKYGVTDVEMKPGDWRCSQCEYVNFARNRNCRECDARRPTPELRPGDWTCPECDFVNFSRNRECHECKAERPPGVGFDAFKKGSTGDREGRFDRGDRGDRGYGRDRESRDVDRRSSRSDSRGGDRDRGSFDRSDRSRERGGERGMDRRSRGDDERDSFDRRSPRGEGDRGSFDRRSAGTGERSGRRNKYEEWKPNLSKKDDFVDEDASDDEFFKKPAKGRNVDEDSDDLDLDLDDDEDVDDVEAFDDEEFENMRTATSAGRSGRSSSGSRRPEGRGFDEDRPKWEDDRPARSSGRGGSRGGRGGDRGGYDGGERDSWSSGPPRRGGRGAGRSGGRGRGASGGRGRR